MSKLHAAETPNPFFGLEATSAAAVPQNVTGEQSSDLSAAGAADPSRSALDDLNESIRQAMSGGQ